MMSLFNFFRRKLTTIEIVGVFASQQPARVDTGASLCSIDVQDLKIEGSQVTFKYLGLEHKLPICRIKEVKSANGIIDRPVVMLTFMWDEKIYHHVETTLTDRSKLTFKILVGRNLIKRINLPVHLSKRELEESKY
jgi:hypothetical protein